MPPMVSRNKAKWRPAGWTGELSLPDHSLHGGNGRQGEKSEAVLPADLSSQGVPRLHDGVCNGGWWQAAIVHQSPGHRRSAASP